MQELMSLVAAIAALFGTPAAPSSTDETPAVVRVGGPSPIFAFGFRMPRPPRPHVPWPGR